MLPILVKAKLREEKRNKSHIDVGKDKGRTGKHYPYSYRKRQRKNREIKAILMQGKTREELKNITNIHTDKDKERTEKQKPY